MTVMHEVRPAERLDSWKEIAAYLNRDERTAQRWEVECGLPVHRTPGRRRGSVFAYRSELDSWLVSHEPSDRVSNLSSQPNEESGENRPVGMQAGSAPEAEGGHSRSDMLRHHKWKFIAAGSACLLLFVGGIHVLLMRSDGATSVPPFRLEKLTNDGRPKLHVETDGKTLYFTELEGARPILVSAPMSGEPIRKIDTPFPGVWLDDLSNDSQRLLVKSVEGTELESPVWVIPAQGGGTPRRVGNVLCNTARWSPDNRKIACAARTTIMVMDADGSNSHTVGSFSLPVLLLAWAPDGEHLRFVLWDPSASTFSPWEIAISKEGSATPIRKSSQRRKLLLRVGLDAGRQEL